MEKDAVETIETAAPNNEAKEDDISPVELVYDEEVETGIRRPVIIRFRTYRYQYRQQQKSISDFDIYRYRYNNNNNNNTTNAKAGLRSA